MKKISLIGANGYIGSHIDKYITSSTPHSINRITRGDSLSSLEGSDFVIHVANPSKRFKAKNEPEWDFNETVIKTSIIKNYCKKINIHSISLVSSISARTQLNTVYGINRKSAELLLDKKDLILRVGPIFGGNKNIGPLYDILNNKDVFVSENTLSAYANVNYYARKIVELTLNRKTGTFELGAKDYILLKDFKKKCNSQSNFHGDNDDQIPLDTFDDSPSVKEVYSFFKI